MESASAPVSGEQRQSQTTSVRMNGFRPVTAAYVPFGSVPHRFIQKATICIFWDRVMDMDAAD